jgi:hypothetical protein
MGLGGPLKRQKAKGKVQKAKVKKGIGTGILEGRLP